jgi:hypothetical protein
MIEHFDCEQNSPEWYRVRLGLPTASEFGTVLAKGKDGGASLTRKKYLHQLAAEIITGEPGENYTNSYMERGKLQEAEARRLYAFVHDAEPERIGFIKNGPKGCSPDALIGSNGLLEIKTRTGHLQVELLLLDRFPPEHRAQVQGALWVSERDWCDLAVYSPGLPLWVGRSYRDDGYIANLAGAVAQFNEELAEIVERVKRYGTPLTEQLKQSVAAL